MISLKNQGNFFLTILNIGTIIKMSKTNKQDMATPIRRRVKYNFYRVTHGGICGNKYSEYNYEFRLVRTDFPQPKNKQSLDAELGYGSYEDFELCGTVDALSVAEAWRKIAVNNSTVAWELNGRVHHYKELHLGSATVFHQIQVPAILGIEE
ncbi:MAG: hypothetical protein HC878_00140 [Leptolyngbyaceae cyanobacterium SL_5_14]|nr:hypothetical protein [Leptolyngbyaceae cyanobacterium SL_5_14]